MDGCRIYCARWCWRGAQLPFSVDESRSEQKLRNESSTKMLHVSAMAISHQGRLAPRTHTQTHTHAPHDYSASTRVITGNWNPLHPTPPPFFYLHLFVYLPFHWVSWFSASLVFGRSAFFLRLCHVFAVILLSIFAAGTGAEGGGGEAGGRRKRDGKAAYSCQTPLVLQLPCGPCDAGDAAEGLWSPAKSAIFRLYLARSVRQW